MSASGDISETSTQIPRTPIHVSDIDQSEARRLLLSPKRVIQSRLIAETRYGAVSQDSEDHPYPPWRSEPHSLSKRRREWWQGAIVDILTISIALPFFALAGTLIDLNGKKVETHQQDIIEQSIKVAATVFPFCFSLVAGRLSIKFAAWKAERGTTLGHLEQLMGSQTVVGTLVTQLRLRSLNYLSLGLIFLWILSPVGGQSVLRILSTTTIPVRSFTNISYIATTLPTVPVDSNLSGSWLLGFATIFSASLIAPEAVKNSSMDLWGNVKIPSLSSLSMLDEDPDGWRHIPHVNYTPVYSSLFGIPLSGIAAGNTTFNLESSYLDLRCIYRESHIIRTPRRSHLHFQNPGLISTNGPFVSYSNVTSQTDWAIGYRGEDYSRLNGTYRGRHNIKSNSTFSGLLLYQDFEGAENVTSIYCTPSQVYVESAISCVMGLTGQSCKVTAQRPSTLKHLPTTITSLSFGETIRSISHFLPDAVPHYGHIDPMQNYIFNPNSNEFIQSAQEPKYSHGDGAGDRESRFLKLSLNDFGDRLGQILNSFLYGSMPNSTQFLTGAPFKNVQTISNPSSASETDITAVTQNQMAAFAVKANFTTSSEVYACSIPWLSCFIAAALAVLLTATLAAIFARMTIARDYLGYVSSLARESQHVQMPAVGADIDGVRRTRMIKDLKLRLGDVGDTDERFEVGLGVGVAVGQLGLGRQEDTRRTDKLKLYV